jgi:hypothetical protein
VSGCWHNKNLTTLISGVVDEIGRDWNDFVFIEEIIASFLVDSTGRWTGMNFFNPIAVGVGGVVECALNLIT